MNYEEFKKEQHIKIKRLNREDITGTPPYLECLSNCVKKLLSEEDEIADVREAILEVEKTFNRRYKEILETADCLTSKDSDVLNDFKDSDDLANMSFEYSRFKDLSDDEVTFTIDEFFAYWKGYSTALYKLYAGHKIEEKK